MTLELNHRRLCLRKRQTRVARRQARLGCFGYAKLARGPDAFIQVLHAIGVPAPVLLGWATILVELVGGAMIFAGALVPLATVPMIVVLVVAILTVHLPNGFSSIKLQSFDAAGAHFGQPGYETDLHYVAGLVALCLGGAGPLSVDGFLRRRPSLRARPQNSPSDFRLATPSRPTTR